MVKLNLLQQDLWEEFRHYCRLFQWSLIILNDAQTSSTRSLGGILSSLHSLSLVSSTFFNKIFGRNFVIIAGFVSGLLTFFMMLKLLQQDLWEEFRHHCWLCQWSLNVLNDALSHQHFTTHFRITHLFAFYNCFSIYRPPLLSREDAW